jgi:peptidoglycan/LPS O-acetylase OafA/YrhL
VADLSSFGHLGVPVFFVISGFVIPWSVRNSTTRELSYLRFLGKRLGRVHPPFLAACLMGIFLNWLSIQMPGYKGNLPADYLSAALSSLTTDSFYLSSIVGRSWILLVAWTLAIEVQFYLMAGVLAPRLGPQGSVTTWAVAMFTGCLAAWLIPMPAWIFHFLPLFAMGWCAVWIRTNPRRVIPWIVCGFAGACSGYLHDGVTALAAAVTFGVICLNVARVPRVFGWLGAISYSLYLVHVPVGGRVINFGFRYASGESGRLLLMIFAALVSVLAAWVFFVVIERPCHCWSRRLFEARKPVSKPVVV